MTVQNTIVKNKYIGNGSTKVFPYTFALNEDDGEFVRVYVTDEEGKESETTDFSVNTETRTVTYPKNAAAPLPAGCVIALMRSIPNVQELNLENQGPFFAQDIEAEFDRVVMMVQQIQDVADRCVKAGPTSELSISDVVISELYEGRDLAVASASAAKISEEAAARSALSAAENARSSATSAAASNGSAANAAISESKAKAAEQLALAHVAEVTQQSDRAAANANAAQASATSAANSAQTATDKAAQAKTASDGSQRWANLAYNYTEPLRHALGNMFEYDANADVQLVADPLIGTDPKWELDANNDLMPV